MRDWMNLFENDEHLYWFWYQPSTGRLEHIEDGTHTLYAIEHLGLDLSQIGEFDTLADNDVLDVAIAAGWVRGRYAEPTEEADRFGEGPHTFTAQDGDGVNLNLQGHPREVLKTARFVAKKWPYSVLYVDFAETHDVHDDMTTKAIGLRGNRLDFYLRKGSIPTAMVQESTEDFGTSNDLFHGTNLDNLWLIMKAGKLTANWHGRDYAGPTGVCLSRSFKVASDHAGSWMENLNDSFFHYFDLGEPPEISGAVLQFDRSRIRETIVPYDDDMDGLEEEERVVGDLSLNALVAIHVNPRDIETFLKYAIEAHKKGGLEYDAEFRKVIERVLKDPRITWP